MVITVGWVMEASASSMYVAKMCRGHQCQSPQHPILDYDPVEKKCVCAAHPCWNDNGLMHSCPEASKPYLHYFYHENKTLQCGCADFPHYSPPYISKVTCFGQSCENKDMVLDFDEEQGKCVCRPHPCHNDKGLKHSCTDPKFPVLLYREEEEQDGNIKTICECFTGMAAPKVEL